jgi:hypothetical protein
MTWNEFENVSDLGMERCIRNFRDFKDPTVRAKAQDEEMDVVVSVLGARTIIATAASFGSGMMSDEYAFVAATTSKTLHHIRYAYW